MTEPDVASSDPTQLQTHAVLEGDTWVINGRKWFTSGADRAAYTTVMCRTETDVPAHDAFSMIIVPTNTPGYNIVRDVRVMGHYGGHCEVAYDNVRVPKKNLLGPRGGGLQDRAAAARAGAHLPLHALARPGAARVRPDVRAREHRASRSARRSASTSRSRSSSSTACAEIQASRLLTLHAAHKIDQGDEARVEIGMIKVVGAQMLHNVIDRAIQVFGAKGVTEDTPLERMYRHARFARIYDGPDEVHITTTARRVLGSTRSATAGTSACAERPIKKFLLTRHGPTGIQAESEPEFSFRLTRPHGSTAMAAPQLPRPPELEWVRPPRRRAAT